MHVYRERERAEAAEGSEGGREGEGGRGTEGLEMTDYLILVLSSVGAQEDPPDTICSGSSPRTLTRV